jgi:hypothetical protein
MSGVSQEDMITMLERLEGKIEKSKRVNYTFDPAERTETKVDAGSTSHLAIGANSGYELLLPKYKISTGRDGDAESVSQARIYLEKKNNWFKDVGALGNINQQDRAYVGFLLSSVQENRSEKVQTTPLNGDNYSTTFYGEAPTIYAFSGVLYNTYYARWREIFSILYDKAFRGSQIAKHRNLLHIVYDNKIISGWMLNLGQSLNASSETMSNFNFQFLVRSESTLSTGKQLRYNNAYFRGAGLPEGYLDRLADLPEYDDYLNVARIKPPPTRQRGTGKGKSYACRPSRVTTIKDGKKKKTKPRHEGQHIRTGSPTRSNCDIVKAATNVMRTRNSELARIQKKKYKSAEDKQSAIDKVENTARAQLRVTYNNLKDTKSIGNASARARAEQFKAATVADGGGFSGFLAVAYTHSNSSIKTSITDQLPPINYTAVPTPQENP